MYNQALPIPQSIPSLVTIPKMFIEDNSEAEEEDSYGPPTESKQEQTTETNANVSSRAIQELQSNDGNNDNGKIKERNK